MKPTVWTLPPTPLLALLKPLRPTPAEIVRLRPLPGDSVELNGVGRR